MKRFRWERFCNKGWYVPRGRNIINGSQYLKLCTCWIFTSPTLTYMDIWTESRVLFLSLGLLVRSVGPTIFRRIRGGNRGFSIGQHHALDSVKGIGFNFHGTISLTRWNLQVSHLKIFGKHMVAFQKFIPWASKEKSLGSGFSGFLHFMFLLIGSRLAGRHPVLNGSIVLVLPGKHS